MKERLGRRAGPLAGTVGIALVVVGVRLGGAASTASDPTDPGEAIASRFAERRDETRLGVAVALVGVLLFLWFLGDLRERLRAAGWLGPVALAGGVLALAGLSLYLAILVAESSNTILVNPEAARTLLVFEWESAVVAAPGFAALVAAASLGAMRLRLLPRWLAWIAPLGLPLAAIVGLGGFFGGYLVGLALLWLFVLAAALSVYPGGPATARPAAP
jgi:hypothetical protein